MNAPGAAPPPPASRPSVAVIDIDGVVADVRHRLPLISSRPRDWPAFFAAAGQDGLLPPGAALVHRLEREHRVVWLSGRPDSLRRVTVRWLAGHGLPARFLQLRRGRDFRPNVEVKLEALAALSKRFDVAVVVDDDPAVIAAASQAGYQTRLADWMPAEPATTLHRAQQHDGRT